MPLYQLARFTVRPEAALDAERVLHDHATLVRSTMPDTMWTTYRERRTPHVFTGLVRLQGEAPDGVSELRTMLAPFLVGEIVMEDTELVTSSDLSRRPPQERRMRTNQRPRRPRG